MEIQTASIRDLGALRSLEHACFEKDAWPLLDLIAVLTWPDVIRLKAVENDAMIGFVAGDPRPPKGSWVATIGVDPALSAARHRACPAACLRGKDQDAAHETDRADVQRACHLAL